MKYIDEFRDPQLARKLLTRIQSRSKRSVRFMEFCGGHTHAIFRHGLRQMLPPTVDLRSGPGCPVCVTANIDIDRAIAMARLPDVILATFGDMLKVPGSHGSLQMAKAEGADVRIVYSPLDALQIARDRSDKNVIFLGIGFETTAPGVAVSVLGAQSDGVENFYVLSLHKLTPPATCAILDAREVRLAGVIGPGHVTTIVGSAAWEFLPRDYSIPCAVAGLMCRNIVSVSWDGYLFDCDFNLARGLPMGRNWIHVSEMTGPPQPGAPIATADHCFTCTAGAGFT